MLHMVVSFYAFKRPVGTILTSLRYSKVRLRKADSCTHGQMTDKVSISSAPESASLGSVWWESLRLPN